MSFSRRLPAGALKNHFADAAPGLEYVSKHDDKLFAFVKYSSEAAALQAMSVLNGTDVLGNALRIRIALPPRGEGGVYSRKRQRTFDMDRPVRQPKLD